MLKQEDTLNVTIEVRVDLKPIMEGRLTTLQMKQEIDNFMDEIKSLRSKYAGWLEDLSVDPDWNEQLKGLKVRGSE